MPGIVAVCFFFFNDTATTEIYTLSLHDALPICLVTKIEDDFRRSIRCQKFLYGCVPKHRRQCLVDVEKPSLRIAPAYSAGGIVRQRTIQRLRMSQGLSGRFQLFAQFLFVQRAANGHRQLSDMFLFNVIESTASD